jgi:hypothetical protein
MPKNFEFVTPNQSQHWMNGLGYLSTIVINIYL